MSIAALFRVATCGFGAMAVFALVFGAMRAPSRTATRLGRRGMKRMKAIAENAAWAKVEPFVRWCGVRVARVVPSRFTGPIDQQIVEAGDYLGLTADEYVALHVIGGILGLLFGVVIDTLGKTHGMARIGFATLGSLAPYLEVSAAAQTRRQTINRRLPFAVDQLSLAMSAGLDFPGAVRQVVSKAQPDDPLAEELGYILQNLKLGHTRKDALLDFARRAPTDAVKEFVQTIVQAEEKGNPIADVLVIQATVSRQRRTTAAEEAASKAGVRMVIPLALIFVTVTILILGPILLKVKGQLKSLDKSKQALVVPDRSYGTTVHGGSPQERRQEEMT
jgi:tight adherence protein C